MDMSEGVVILDMEVDLRPSAAPRPRPDDEIVFID